ncbi:hypothetical protein KO481_19500 [Nocardia sp. NEAU-G5]|uniref:Lipoprotein n=1 Tax=Nocardia albiluteola TaxID=2842303 RepID=A0ABS6B076_9NOCA|nr:hypothetical protein [Nocardia albiluteola]MBU3063708.1 hypothetical protein [Nocardia albiluteola]
MTSLVKRIGLPLAVLACTAVLAGCNGSSKSDASSSSSDGANTHSAVYTSECKAMVKIFSDKSLPASARDPETVVNGFKNGPEWKVLTSQQQTDAVAGIRKAGTGSCD